MTRCARCLVLLVVSVVLAAPTGCGDSSPTPPATDPDTVEKLKALQKQGGQGEKPGNKGGP